ncbi:hypothetical protein D9M70_625760 [compost metagenome]
MPASRARELALMARSGIPDEIRRRAIGAIARAVRLGHGEAIVDLGDLNLDFGIPDNDLDGLIHEVVSELESVGYKVKFDDADALWLGF